MGDMDSIVLVDQKKIVTSSFLKSESPLSIAYSTAREGTKYSSCLSLLSLHLLAPVMRN
jgi:hypothetical protein